MIFTLIIDFLQIQLPEFMLLTPYFDILSKSSVQFFIDVNSLDMEITDKDHVFKLT